MPTNPGSLFMGLHPHSAANGARGSDGISGLCGHLWRWTTRVVACLLLHGHLLASNKLVSYHLANKISNWYLKSKKYPHFCPKAGIFFPNKAWHTNSWFCTTERVETAGTHSCLQDCSKGDMPPSKQRATLLGTGMFGSVCTSLCQSSSSLPFAVGYKCEKRWINSLFDYDQIKRERGRSREEKEERGEDRERDHGCYFESGKSEISANSCSTKGHRVLVSLSVTNTIWTYKSLFQRN